MKLPHLILATVVLVGGSAATLAASWASTSGFGLSSHAVDVRSGSVGHGRVFVGGGLHGGK